MADMGLGMMGAAAGAGDGIAQLFDQRLKAAQLSQQDALTRLKVQEVADARAETIKQREDVATERAQHQKEVEQDRADQRARQGYPLIPLNQPVSQQTVSSMTAAGIPQEAFSPTPDPSLQPPAAIASPDAGPDPSAGTIANSPSPAQRTYQRAPSAAEQQTARQQASMQGLLAILPQGPAGDRQRAIVQYEEATGKNAPASMTTDPNEQFDKFKRQHDYEVAHPTSQPQPQIFYDAQNKPHAIQFANGAVREVPLPDGITGKTPDKAGQKDAADTKKAVNVIGQVDQSLDSVKDLVGPAAGRGETVEQWLGSADPKIQAFGTKLLLAKMLIDKQVTGSARAGASPALLAKWDALLSNKVSYEGMKAALQAAKEIVGAGTDQSTPSAGAGKRIRYDMNGNRIAE